MKESFFELTPERILNAVETLGFQTTGRVLPLNSYENRVYEIGIEPDERSKLPAVVAKFYRPARWSLEQILDEHRFIKELENNEIPVVSPYKNTQGETVLKETDSGIIFSVFPKFQGKSLDEFNDDQVKRLGRLIARMHGVGKMSSKSSRIELTPATYGATAQQVLENTDCIPENKKEFVLGAVKRALDMIDTRFGKPALQRIHGDCHFGNILWNSQGPCFVDFDDHVIGPPVQDLWLLIPGRDEYSREQFSKLLEAYETMNAFDRSTLKLIEPLRTLRIIHYSAWIAKRWEDPSFPKLFPHFTSEKYWDDFRNTVQEQCSILEES